MTFHKGCPFDIKLGPLIGNDILIIKMTRSIVVHALLMSLCIINEFKSRLSFLREIWSIDREWYLDFKNDKVAGTLCIINKYI